MQRFLPVVFALVVGILLGSFQPRGEVLALRAELDSIKGEKGRDCKNDSTRQIRELIGADKPSATPRTVVSEAPAQENTPPENPPTEEGGENTQPDQPQDLSEMIAVLDTRRAQALAALKEQGDLSPEQLDQFNATMQSFNESVKKSLDAFVATGLEKGAIERHDALVLAADVLDSVIVAEDQVHNLLSEEQLQGLDPESIDPLSYISGDTARVLEQIRDLPSEDF